MVKNDDWPEEGELLVCTVKNVRENGAYLNLDSYEGKEGFVFIGEVSAGWVKNIRSHVREGQRVVAKVIEVKKDKESINLSIKAVSDERRRDTLQGRKNQQRAEQMMRLVSEKMNWKEEEVSKKSTEMTDIFGTLYGALEECAISETALTDAGFSGKWIGVVTEIAIDNIIPPFVEIRGNFDIEVWSSEGVNAIKEVLMAAESCAEDLEEVTLTCHYNGAPHYRVDIRAPDYPTAESVWEAAQEVSKKYMDSVEGSISIERL
jgi:translation initiation factor 2 subunit 1|tara:strand:- start:9885 stop:10670 length:786 start_codon:yes stop_codon:yes gene_type:complete